MSINLLSKATAQVDSIELFEKFFQLIFQSWHPHASSNSGVSVWVRKDSAMLETSSTERHGHFDIIEILSGFDSPGTLTSSHAQIATIKVNPFKTFDAYLEVEKVIQEHFLNELKQKNFVEWYNTFLTKTSRKPGDYGFSIKATDGAITIGFYKPYYAP